MRAVKCEACWGTGQRVDHALLGRVARTRRISRGLRLADMAAMMDISPSFLSLLESGRRRWTIELHRRSRRLLAARKP